VEKATIFFISFCTIAQEAANRAVIAPNTRMACCTGVLGVISGDTRTSKKTPATTIVELCKRADTGVGPSMAAGSHGCKPNWADFPVAANRHPQRNREESRDEEEAKAKKESKDQLDVAIINHPEANKIPISPIRLYIIAWRAAVLASARVNHHPIKRKDRNPTPSQPIRS